MSTRRRATLLVAVLGAAALLAGCGGGGGDASRDSVADDVADYLLERDVSAGGPLNPAEAETVATCVANAIFDDSIDDPFSRDERNDVVSGSGDEPDAELAGRVEGIVDDCLTDAE